MTMCDDHGTHPSRRALVRGAGALGLAAAATPALGLPGAAAAGRRTHRVLVYSRTAGYRHASIPLGVATVEQLGAEHGFDVVATEDPGAFTDRTLRRFTAVVFLNTTGEVMTPRGRAALRRFVLAGGGWAGVHSAADTEYDWPFYTRLLAGGRFLAHPLQQPGVVVREAPRHLSTRHLPSESFPDGYEPVSGVMGDHPMSWQHRVGGGLSWYTALGHEVGMYLDPAYRKHLLGGLLTVTRHGRRTLG
jgi:type 1 glutamine amidotransferase